MELLFITLGIFVLLYVGFVFLYPKVSDSAKSEHTQQALKDIFDDTHSVGDMGGDANILRSEYVDNEGLAGALAQLPVMSTLHRHAISAGYARNMNMVFLVFFAVLIGVTAFFIVQGMNPLLAILVGPLLTYFVFNNRLKNKNRKRNDAFIMMFPDVLDMCVRSLRSGFPISIAMRMIAENMDPPVSTEFKQVVEEMESGRSVVESLSRLSRRINEPDVNFFIVVLKLQQETGGNLAETIANLSKVIRQRKQLRMKVRALTSEGRTTSYILGSLPFLIFGAIYTVQKDYLEILWTTFNGYIVLGISLSLVASCLWIVNKMVQIEV